MHGIAERIAMRMQASEIAFRGRRHESSGVDDVPVGGVKHGERILVVRRKRDFHSAMTSTSPLAASGRIVRSIGRPTSQRSASE
jgi:hypothetical protein